MKESFSFPRSTKIKVITFTLKYVYLKRKEDHLAIGAKKISNEEKKIKKMLFYFENICCCCFVEKGKYLFYVSADKICCCVNRHSHMCH